MRAVSVLALAALAKSAYAGLHLELLISCGSTLMDGGFNEMSYIGLQNLVNAGFPVTTSVTENPDANCAYDADVSCLCACVRRCRTGNFVC